MAKAYARERELSDARKRPKRPCLPFSNFFSKRDSACEKLPACPCMGSAISHWAAAYPKKGQRQLDRHRDPLRCEAVTTHLAQFLQADRPCLIPTRNRIHSIPVRRNCREASSQ